MKKIVASLIFTAMLVSLTACGSRTDKDAEFTKESAVIESGGVSPVTEEDGAESEETGSANTEAEENAENAAEDAVTDSANSEVKAADNKSSPEETNRSTDHMEDNTIKITAGDTSFTATLADNLSVKALKELLAEGPLTINMNDYAGMEKVGPIGTSLPRNDEQISTGAGDIILYQGNSLVIYYDTNSWDFTRIGKIEGVTGEALLSDYSAFPGTAAYNPCGTGGYL